MAELIGLDLFGHFLFALIKGRQVMKPPRVGSTEFKAKKYWLASSYRTKDRLRTAGGVMLTTQ